MKNIVEVLTTSVAPVSTGYAQELALEHFGVSATASCLASERDQNFYLKADDGREYVLKITNPAEDRQVTNFQTQALMHIGKVDPELAVQRVFPALDGVLEPVIAVGGGTQQIVRLLSFLQGIPLHKVDRTSAQRHNLGTTLARLDLALRGFFHPAAGYELLWDIKHSSRLRQLLVHIPDENKRALAGFFLDNFEKNALPVMPGLRAQVIHNDFQPYNILVDAADHDKVSGVIDFGDCVHAPLIDDLAVACTYHIHDAPQPLDYAAELVSSYHQVLPLERGDADILFDLIAVRMVMTVAITGWRAAIYPENAVYILRNNPMSWNGLERFAAMPRWQAQQILRRACNME